VGQALSKQPLSAVEKLTPSHDLSSFDCGKAVLNDWLQRFAVTNQQNNSAVTYVTHRANTVIGYYSTTAGAVKHEEAPVRVAKGLARHPIGVILLARLAVDKSEIGQGLGKLLLRDALTRALAAADSIGARAVLVHALDDDAVSFYKKYGFEASPMDDKTLMLLMNDLRTTLRGK
jgi:GNAT superfamily N-acetyltransferase